MNLSPTPAQKRLYDFLAGYFEEHGVYPSQREICREFGWKSVASCHAMLHRLDLGPWPVHGLQWTEGRLTPP